MENLLIVGITCSLLLTLLVIAKEKKSSSDRLFLTWLVVLTVHFSLLYIRYSGLHWEYPHFLGLDTSFGLLHIPILFLYIRSLTSSDSVKLAELVLHFTPFIIINVPLVTDFYFLSIEDKKLVYTAALEVRRISITDVLIILQSVLYFYFSVRAVNLYHARIKASFSALEGINLFWIQKIIVVFAVGFGLKLLFNLLVLIGFAEVVFFEKAVVGVFCLLLLYLGYHGIRSTSIFDKNQMHSTEKNQYGKSGLKQKEILEHVGGLKKYMESKKPYLNDNLTLSELAEKLDLSSNHLSQVINQGVGKSFYDFINEYRVEEVKEKLSSGDYAHLKLLAIAFECGFKSKSTFNTFFKKTVGVTPSEFRNNSLQK